MENEPQQNEEEQQLYSLLSSWNLLQLFDKLKEQQCYVSVLKVIKTHQIEKVVANVPVGLAILFEHCLETWRSEIKLPIKCSTPDNISFSSEYSNCSKEKHEFNEDLQFILMKSKNGQSL
ncbi:hypothetical protein FF38_00800, partial [Lucilia cuprina]